MSEYAPLGPVPLQPPSGALLITLTGATGLVDAVS